MLKNIRRYVTGSNYNVTVIPESCSFVASALALDDLTTETIINYRIKLLVQL